MMLLSTTQLKIYAQQSDKYRTHRENVEQMLQTKIEKLREQNKEDRERTRKKQQEEDRHREMMQEMKRRCRH